MVVLFSCLYPLILLLTLRYFGLTLNDALILKFVPLALSFYVMLLMVLSYLKKESFLFKFIKKFNKKEFGEEEKEYIRKSTLFWIGICIVNLALHVIVLIQPNEYLWLVYSSFGWYGVFALGGILQYLHRKFIFLKRVKNG